MKFDELTYTVAEMMGPPQKLTIKQDGETRYESHSSASTPDTPEIGLYTTRLSSAEIEMLSRALDDPPFQSLPDHSGRIAAGDRYQRISVSSGSSTNEKSVGTTEPVDSGLATLLGRLDQIVTSAMQHPKRTVRMTVPQAAIDDSGTVTIDFELFGSGTEAAEVVNPARLAGTSGLSIRGWPDQRSGESQQGEVFGVNAEKIIEVGSPPDAAPQAFLQLVPNQKRSFRATVRLRVPGPQTYLTQLIYQNTTDYPGGPPVLVGELVSKAFKLSVPALKR